MLKLNKRFVNSLQSLPQADAAGSFLAYYGLLIYPNTNICSFAGHERNQIVLINKICPIKNRYAGNVGGGLLKFMMTSRRTFIEEPAERFAAARARLVGVTVARLQRAPRLDLLDLALEDTTTETARHCDRNKTTL